MAQVTFTTLGNNVISNGLFSVRYVIDGDTPRFVLRDIITDLGYSNISQEGAYWSKQFGREKLYSTKKGQVVNCVTKEQVDELLSRHHKKPAPFASVFRLFWNDVISRVETEAEICRLKAKIVSLEAALKEREVA